MDSVPDQPITQRAGLHRLAAIIALGCWAATAFLMLALLLRNLPHLTAAFTGVAIAIIGGWWTITERGAMRLLGVAVVAFGGTVVVLAIAGTSDGLASIGWRVAALAILTTAGLVAGRYAMRRQLHTRPRADPAVDPPRRPVLICNPWSGGGKVGRFDLRAKAEALGIRTIELTSDDDLEALARGAVEEGADCLGMAGGDGSQAVVALVAAEHDLPFVVVPAGTRNHLALDLSLDRDDPTLALSAFSDGLGRTIDYATVNDRIFVNNVSLGLYATIVQEDGYRDDKLGTAAELLPELLGTTSEPFDLQFTGPDGTRHEGAVIVQVSNNPYELTRAIDFGSRFRLDTGRLGVVALWATNAVEVAGLLALATANQIHLSSSYGQWECTEFVVESGEPIPAGIDGEAVTLESPVTFRIHPGGLRLLVPADNLRRAETRRSRDVRLSSLVTVAFGASSADPGE